MAKIRSSGSATKEASYYTALENLLNEVGKSLQPEVVCIGQPSDSGAGRPDFGLYGSEQCDLGSPRDGQTPRHGVVEVKGLSNNVVLVAKSSQTMNYLDMYRYVLVTNYRDFYLVDKNDTEKPVDRYTLAETEEEFLKLERQPKKTTTTHGPKLLQFLRFAISQGAKLHRPQDIASQYATFAREALTILEKYYQANDTSIDPLIADLGKALGVDFHKEESKHFFLSTLVQTLFYGLFSAWIAHVSKNKDTSFSWKSAAHDLSIPMIRSLFEEFSKPTRLSELGLMTVLERASGLLNRIDVDEFFKHFSASDASQFFYEPFLEAFDPELRKALGVWYTPREVVQYMVERIDRMLRDEFGKVNGLANEDVIVLDPCCGTGTYIIEVLKRIEKTLRETRNDDLVGNDVKLAATNRIVGFEILPASFVIAHWQISDYLSEIGCPLDSSSGERCSIYLTNALTGWESTEGEHASFLFPEMDVERRKAEHVKQRMPILVVLGNPPYNSYAGTSPETEGGSVDSYKIGLQSKYKLKKFNLDDLYVRFMRIAERRIERNGQGILAYITNHSYKHGKAFVVMRHHLLNTFDKIFIDGLNGDSRQTKKLTPDGKSDPSIFSTELNREGIRVGTCIGFFIKTSHSSEYSDVSFREFWGDKKRQLLLDSLNSTDECEYRAASPSEENLFAFTPIDVCSEYSSWPNLIDLSNIEPINGLMEARRGALIDIDSQQLEQRMQQYYDKSISWEQLVKSDHGLAFNAARFNARSARDGSVGLEKLGRGFNRKYIVPYVVRPFDTRFAYWVNFKSIWNTCRPEFWKHLVGCLKGNEFFVSRPASVCSPEGVPACCTHLLGDYDVLRGHAKYFPLYTYKALPGETDVSKIANLSTRSREYLRSLGCKCPDDDVWAAQSIWRHALAITYSPLYLKTNADALAIDWLRIPLPSCLETFQDSVSLGSTLFPLVCDSDDSHLLDSFDFSSCYNVIGRISGRLLELSGGWGNLKQNRVYPGRGHIEHRDWTLDERSILEEGFAALGIDTGRSFELLGSPVDVYLNDETFWSGVPTTVWEYKIGGFQVIKKWLSYREMTILDRLLTPDEVREVSCMIRRLTSLVLLSDELDFNYNNCQKSTFQWSAS